MDALRLRPAKGLRFVSQIGKARDQLSVLMLMQQLRRMHCIVSAESTLKIVNASQSPTKFIFSDHPVTLLNAHVFPADPRLPPGEEPHPHWLGTQTLFPLDALLWNRRGELTECTRGNIALCIDGRWLTLALEAGLLDGLGRQRWLREGRIAEAVVRVEDLRRASGLAFFNSLRGWLDAELV